MSRPVALVTGAAQGIGLATAQRLARTHRLALLDLNEERLERARATCGDDAVAVVCDIARQDQVEHAVAEVVERCGGIDVLFSNAGIGAGGTLRHLDPAVLQAIVDVNLVGNWRVIHACLPSLVERRGYVLANASASALMPALGLGPYASSKAGLEQLMNVLRVEVAHLGVGVGVSYFWFLETDMVQGAEREMGGIGGFRTELPGVLGRIASLDDAVEAIVKAIEGRRRRVVFPRWVSVVYRLRGLQSRHAEAPALKCAGAMDAATRARVRELGSFDAAFRCASPAHRAAARHVQHELHETAG
jgi:NAD(P)-dependent dehydrogenase (short-subunit alcohol dehydrogenase family)